MWPIVIATAAAVALTVATSLVVARFVREVHCQ